MSSLSTKSASSALDWNSKSQQVFSFPPKSMTIAVLGAGIGAVKSGEADTWVTGEEKETVSGILTFKLT